MVEEVKKRTSLRFRRQVAFARVKARLLTAKFRPLPNVLVIGGQRCGTSSLYKYLGSHPEVGASLRKEVRFFTKYMVMGEDWYRSHFGLEVGPKKIFFEATPDYLLDPRVPQRVAELMPGVSLIVLLRDPIVRAFSHYNHNRRLGVETLSFQEAILQENHRIGPAWLKMLANDDIPTPDEVLRYSYVRRGMYSLQLEEWLKYFPKDQFHVMRSEALYAQPQEELVRVFKFLQISHWDLGRFDNFSYISARPEAERIPEGAKEILADRYEADSERLRDLVGDRFVWTQ